jgi:tetratricopeptide (TPR) repeat protein
MAASKPIACRSTLPGGIHLTKTRTIPRSDRSISTINYYPQYAPAWYQLGVIVDNQGQIDEAILAYQQALTINLNYA